MKDFTKSIYKYMIGFFFAFFLVLSGGISYAVNPFEEINAVSQDPYSAHSLYLGMPEKEYQEKFKNESWIKMKDSYEGDCRNIYYSRHIDYGVWEFLAIVIIRGKVGFYEFSFTHYAKNANLLTDMYKIAGDNITKVFGKTSNHKEDKNGTVRRLIWKTGTEQEIDLSVDVSDILKNPKSPAVTISVLRQGNPAYL